MKQAMLCALMFGCAAGAQAQSAVIVYGNVDLGLARKTGTGLAVARRNNNALGVKGSEDLGAGWSAFMQLEIRFVPDLGVVEGGTRPLFQG